MGLTENQGKQLERIKTLTGESDEELLSLLIVDAEDFILAYTNRKKVPTALYKTVGDLALVSFNRLGTEGEKGRSEGGESYSFDDAPHSIFSVLNKYRLARCGGHAHEKE